MITSPEAIKAGMAMQAVRPLLVLFLILTISLVSNNTDAHAATINSDAHATVIDGDGDVLLQQGGGGGGGGGNTGGGGGGGGNTGGNTGGGGGGGTWWSTLTENMSNIISALVIIMWFMVGAGVLFYAIAHFAQSVMPEWVNNFKGFVPKGVLILVVANIVLTIADQKIGSDIDVSGSSGPSW